MAASLDVRSIPVSKIRPNPYQPRQSFPRESLEELSASIREQGLLQPILVRPRDGVYQVACGERRLRATEMAGIKEILAVVRDMDDKTLRLCSITENFHREDLEADEREKAFHDLWKKHFEPDGFSQTAMAKALGIGESTVNENVAAYERRHALNVPRAPISPSEKGKTGSSGEGGRGVTTSDLSATRTLDAKSARAVLSAKVRGKIDAKDLDRIAPVLRDAAPERRPAIIQEVLESHRKAEDFKEETRKEVHAFGRGEIRATSLRVDMGPDLRRAEKFKDVWEEVRFWNVASVESIESEKVRQKVVQYLFDTRAYCDGLLKQLERRKWYAPPHR
jgi:ParB/RepB/Spo0J family partition protein